MGADDTGPEIPRDDTWDIRSGDPSAPRPPRTSSWRINWIGIVPVAVLAVAAFVAWGVVTGDDDDSAGAGAATTTQPTRTTLRPRPTTPPATVRSAPPAPTTVAETAPPTEPEGPTVLAWGELKPCRFGDSCLAVSFRVTGFDPPEATFLCIYPNSTREFSFDGSGKIDACLTGDEGDVVIIEVADVQSEPVSADALDPAGAAP